MTVSGTSFFFKKTADILTPQADVLLTFVPFRDPTCALNMERLLEARISSAVDLRRSLGLPSANTNAYRLINSEGDRYMPNLPMEVGTMFESSIEILFVQHGFFYVVG